MLFFSTMYVYFFNNYRKFSIKKTQKISVRIKYYTEAISIFLMISFPNSEHLSNVAPSINR